MKNGTLCKIRKTNSYLDGITVAIKGIASEHATVTYYIVERTTTKREPEFFENGYSCIVMTEHCLEQI